MKQANRTLSSETDVGSLGSGPMSRQELTGAARALPIALLIGSGLLIAVWVVSALVMAGRGLDLSDESYYLLSYRWWDSTPRAVSGVQYLYGPVFELFGHSVAGLRCFRLVTVLVAHAGFAWAFVTWLRSRRPTALPTTAWALAAGLAIVAAGGANYGWLPLSPGYNDVAALTSLLMLAAVLRALRAVESGLRLPVGPAVALGVLAVLLVVAKWASAGVTLVFLVVTAVVAFRAAGARGWVRFAAVGAVAALAAAAGLGALVGGYGAVVPPLIEVNRLVASSTNAPLTLVRMYLTTGVGLVGYALLYAVLAGVFLLLAVVVGRRGHPRVAGGLVVASPVLALVLAEPGRAGLPGGGAARITTYAACLVAMAILIGGAVLVARRDRAASGSVTRPGGAVEGVVAVALFALPAIQGLGTGNRLYDLAVNQAASWIALFVLAATVVGGTARLLVVSATGCAVVVAAQAGAFGLLAYPYRTTGYSGATARIGGSGPLSALSVSPAEADRLAAVRDAVGPVARGRPMMAFDELPGVILALDGRSVGEAWYSATDRPRSAANIEDACAHGNPWGTAQPVLVADRPLGSTEAEALAHCDLNLDTDFHQVGVAGFPGLSVYLPVEERTSP